MHTERLVIKMYETDLINVTEYQTANQKLTIQRNWQQRVHKMKTNEIEFSSIMLLVQGVLQKLYISIL
jgi:hypothetical protein